MTMKITLDLTGPKAPEVLHALAEAMKPFFECRQEIEAPVVQEYAGGPNIVLTSAAAPEKIQAATEPETASAAPILMPTPTPMPASAPQTEEPEKKYTLDDISRAGAALIDQGKMAQLRELLGAFGVQAVTQLEAAVYPEFARKLIALGAKL